MLVELGDSPYPTHATTSIRSRADNQFATTPSHLPCAVSNEMSFGEPGGVSSRTKQHADSSGG